MAWLSVGDTNDDLCNKLVGHGVLRPGAILNAFRVTDRGDFVQQDCRWATCSLHNTLHHGMIMIVHLTHTTWEEYHSSSLFLCHRMCRSLAYADRPFKHEHVHISAPHMYATVLEQLELCEGLSFLNIGTLKCFVWCAIDYQAASRKFSYRVFSLFCLNCIEKCVISPPKLFFKKGKYIKQMAALT